MRRMGRAIDTTAPGTGAPVTPSTERPVTTRVGTNVVLGLDPSRIPEIADATVARGRRHNVPPLWDGRASERIADVVLESLE